jgi:hypothetical protein
MIKKDELIDTLIETYEHYISFLSGEINSSFSDKSYKKQRKYVHRIMTLKWVLSDKYRERKDTQFKDDKWDS